MQKLPGFLLFCAGGVWHWIWDGIKGMAFERGVNMATPLIGQITLDQVINWLPTIVLPCFGAWLLWKTRPINQQVNSNSPQPVTVGNITVNQAPQPELRITPRDQMQNEDGTVFSVYEVEIISPYPPGNLFIDAQAEGIISLEVRPTRSGVTSFGHTGCARKSCFYNYYASIRKIYDIDKTSAPLFNYH